MILDENPNFPQNLSKICIFKILIKKNEINKGQIFFNFLIFILLDLFTTVPIFKSIGPLVAPPNGLKSSKITQWD